VIEGVLLVPAQQLRTSGGLEELTHLFSQSAAAKQLMPVPASVLQAHVQYPAAFADACQTVEAMEGLANFLFAALSVPRPAGMELSTLLQLGMRFRREAGIDSLERVLMHTTISPAQEALRGHALQALRRAQQLLLAQVLRHVLSAKNEAEHLGGIVEAVLKRLKINRGSGHSAEPVSMEHAVLEVWGLSDAASSVTSVAGAGIV
jgi:glutamate dehydrogenase